MRNYVILNLADRTSLGAVAKARTALQLRLVDETGAELTREERKALAPTFEVPVHNLFDALDAEGDQQVEDALSRAREDCREADKIILCTHGWPDDRDNFYAGRKEVLGDVGKLADLMRKLLPDDRTCHVSLAMCYGARTRKYLPEQLDQQGPVPVEELVTSFAYKLFGNLSLGPDARRIVLTARTAALAYAPDTGESIVEQEAALTLRLEMDEYARKLKHSAWGRRRSAMMANRSQSPGSSKRRRRMEAIESRFLGSKPPRITFKQKKLEAKKYASCLRKKRALETLKFNFPDLPKYGKIVYRSPEPGTVCVVRKYTHQKRTDTVLYEGPFL